MALKFKLNIQLFAEEGAETNDTGNTDTIGSTTDNQTDMEEIKNENIFEMGGKGNPEGDSTGNTGESAGEGEGETKEVVYDLLKIEGLNEGQLQAVRDTDEFKGIVKRAEELGLNQEQFNFVAGSLVTNSLGMLESHRAEILELNPPKEVIYERLSDVAKQTIQSGQLENFLTKASGDDTILERVNKCFNSHEQFEILSLLSKGFASSHAGADGERVLNGGYTNKQDYFNDLNLHQDLIRRAGEASKLGNPHDFTRLNSEAKQLMAEIQQKKRTGISSIFN